MNNPKKKQPKRIIPLQQPGERIINKAETHPADLLAEQFIISQRQSQSTQQKTPDPTHETHVRDVTEGTEVTYGIEPIEPIEPAPVSPTRDFTKVANSLFRNADLFKGMSRTTYDALYQKTRGAIVPVRRIQLTKSELCQLTGLSDKTVFHHISYLKQVGLIRVDYAMGKHDGSFYEVMIPDEIGVAPNPWNPGNPSKASNPSHVREGSEVNQLQNLPPIPSQNVPLVGMGKTEENKEDSSNLKTLFKTNKENFDDDKAFRLFIEKFKEIFKNLAGENYTPNEEKLLRLAELVGAELTEAASKTKSVTDPAAFLLTHLRRRLGVRSVMVESKPGPNKSATPHKREIVLSDDEIQECPDCHGRLVIYPEGQGRGAIVCRHPALIKAKSK
jgi:hypothetical protein